MAFVPELRDTHMVLRSVGDHSMEEGMAQLRDAMTDHAAHVAATGCKLPLLFDMLESEEQKSPDDLKRAADRRRGTGMPGPKQLKRQLNWWRKKLA